jgi:hypothetical protein
MLTFPCFEKAFIQSLQQPFLTINSLSDLLFLSSSEDCPEEESNTESEEEFDLLWFYFLSLLDDDLELPLECLSLRSFIYFLDGDYKAYDFSSLFSCFVVGASLISGWL